MLLVDLIIQGLLKVKNRWSELKVLELLIATEFLFCHRHMRKLWVRKSRLELKSLYRFAGLSNFNVSG